MSLPPRIRRLSEFYTIEVPTLYVKESRSSLMILIAFHTLLSILKVEILIILCDLPGIGGDARGDKEEEVVSGMFWKIISYQITPNSSCESSNTEGNTRFVGLFSDDDKETEAKVEASIS
jgi:hypothetical protein